MAKRTLIFLICLGLFACSPAPTPTPTVTTIHAVTTPAFETLVTEWISQYLDAQDAVRIDLQVLTLRDAIEAAEDGSVDIIFAGAQPPGGWFATPIFAEGIAVVVHPTNRIRSLVLDEAAALFRGEVDTWTGLGGADLPVQVIIPLPGDEIRDLFKVRVLQGAGFSHDAFLAPSPLVMTTLVNEEESAIGFMPLSHVSNEVKALRLNGVAPQSSAEGNGRYPLTLEIRALAPERPGGETYEWLAWLQASLSMGTP